ncbi:MAG: NYN domain-containing protein [Ekhidna sp.]|nr:NYN domain-containing protein [Ekhidna sp.]MBC6410454.1 NYN domain-containing protein [Ekhidna sp.]MBC6425402.1 NYN domain-containing protein [Ekhidna sp.]
MRSGVKVAILVDGDFFLKRYRKLYNGWESTPEEVAKVLVKMCGDHVAKDDYLSRIFYYDCLPLQKKAHNPISKKSVDFSKSETAKFRMEFFKELKKKRKIALRLGYLKSSNNWIISPEKTKEILKGALSVSNLSESDVTYQIQQKSVDMKIGLDIASLSYKKHIEKIILVSGDGDFVPAAKLARREGVDVVLDPMWNNVDESLFEHIDGLKSTSPRPKNRR